jgi:hypothetical protein
MDATLDVMRQQMDDTKLQLSEKLDSLEQQVSNTVQSTGTAVNATVEAVQETVETVTGAVQDAVQSVSNAFDLPRQINRHPWLALGGSFALGCLAVEYLNRSAKRSRQPPEAIATSAPVADDAGHGIEETAGQNTATAAALAGAYEAGLNSSAWHQLRRAAVGAFLVIAQDVAVRAVPQVLNYLSRGKSAANSVGAEAAGAAPAAELAGNNGSNKE